MTSPKANPKLLKQLEEIGKQSASKEEFMAKARGLLEREGGGFDVARLMNEIAPGKAAAMRETVLLAERLSNEEGPELTMICLANAVLTVLINAIHPSVARTYGRALIKHLEQSVDLVADALEENRDEFDKVETLLYTNIMTSCKLHGEHISDIEKEMEKDEAERSAAFNEIREAVAESRDLVISLIENKVEPLIKPTSFNTEGEVTTKDILVGNAVNRVRAAQSH